MNDKAIYFDPTFTKDMKAQSFENTDAWSSMFTIGTTAADVGHNEAYMCELEKYPNAFDDAYVRAPVAALKAIHAGATRIHEVREAAEDAIMPALAPAAPLPAPRKRKQDAERQARAREIMTEEIKAFDNDFTFPDGKELKLMKLEYVKA